MLLITLALAAITPSAVAAPIPTIEQMLHSTPDEVFAGAEAGQRHVLLKCSVSAVQSDPRTMHDFYRKLPVSRVQFAKDIWDQAIMQLAIPPSTGWLIDYDVGTVKELDSGFPVLNIIEIKSDLIVAEAHTDMWWRRVELSRVTGHAMLSVTAHVDDWNRKFGTSLKPYRIWDFDCGASQAKF